MAFGLPAGETVALVTSRDPLEPLLVGSLVGVFDGVHCSFMGVLGGVISTEVAELAAAWRRVAADNHDTFAAGPKVSLEDCWGCEALLAETGCRLEGVP